MTKQDYTNTKAFLVARVSEASQIKALPAQKRNLEEYAEKYGFDSEYHEIDETAYKSNRDKFQEIVKKVADYDGFRVVVFDKIDRFTRDASNEAVGIFKELVKQGVLELHFPSDGLVLHKNSPATDKARLGMGMVFGEYYSSAISDNVKRRQRDKIAKGEWPSKAYVGYKNITTGYDSRGDKITDIVLDEDRAPFIKQAFELRLQGLSIKTIAKTLEKDGLTHPKSGRRLPNSSVEQMLKNEFYAGTACWNGQKYKHKYPTIISKKTFDAVQRINSDRTKNGGKKELKGGKEVYTLTKMVRCGKCGGLMSPYVKKGHTYLRCSKRSDECGNPGVSEAEVCEVLEGVLARLAITESDVQRVLGKLKAKHDDQQLYYANQIASARKEYDRLKRQIDMAYEDRMNGSITLEKFEEISKVKQQRMDELDELVTKLSSEDKSFIVDVPYLLELAKRAVQLFKSSRNGLKNEILKIIFSNLKVTDKKVEFVLYDPYKTLYLGQSKKSVLTDSFDWLPGPGSNRQPRS